MDLKLLSSAAALCVGAALAAPASATVYDFTYASGAAPLEASGTFTVAADPSSSLGYDITGITGNVDGDAITGLVSGGPALQTSSDGLFNYDNQFSPTVQYLTNGGVLFDGLSGKEYNLFAVANNTPTTAYQLYAAQNGGYTANSLGTLSITAVPEPASWAIMLVGFGGLGAVMRVRRKQALAAV